MLSNIITFSANKIITENKDIAPIPCKLNIPDWFKDLKHQPDDRSVKGCMPFLDTLTTGYILKTPIDYYLQHNIPNNDNRESRLKTSLYSSFAPYGVNLNYAETQKENHPKQQLGNCPFNKKNKDQPFHKIMNPWTIKTPSGYSCLFLPPLNNADDRFSIIPGIVDTDIYPGEINFPIIVNGDKYPILETIIKMGTPFVQIIPFKREPWKMKIDNLDEKKMSKFKFNFASQIYQTYKNLYWSKKSWK